MTTSPTILVTGATGKVGRNIVTGLLGREARVRALVREPAAAMLPPEVEAVRGDLTDPVAVEFDLIVDDEPPAAARQRMLDAGADPAFVDSSLAYWASLVDIVGPMVADDHLAVRLTFANGRVRLPFELRCGGPALPSSWPWSRPMPRSVRSPWPGGRWWRWAR